MTISLSELLVDGADAVTVTGGRTIEMEPPFTPGIDIALGNGDESVTVARLSVTAARKLAFEILAECEGGLQDQESAQWRQELVDQGGMPASQAPFYEPKLREVR